MEQRWRVICDGETEEYRTRQEAREAARRWAVEQGVCQKKGCK